RSRARQLVYNTKAAPNCKAPFSNYFAGIFKFPRPFSRSDKLLFRLFARFPAAFAAFLSFLLLYMLYFP
ncbi:MAG: hypothetical protein DBY06_04295, partial [Clostridiales bacterium]